MSAALCETFYLASNTAIRDAYVWIDPGKSTGWAVWWDSTNGGDFESGQESAFLVEDDLYQSFKDDCFKFHVGWELYLLTSGSTIKQDGSAVKVIGFLEWVTQHCGCSVLDPQPSSARNLGSSGGKLQRLGWYKPGQDDANAASAHLLAYMLRENKLPAHLMSKLLPKVD